MKKHRVEEGAAGNPAFAAKKGSGVGALAAVTAALLLGTGGQAYGFEIVNDNPDLKIRLDDTFRYSAGVRMQKRDPLIANRTLFSSSDMKFDRGDMVTNRLDLFTEFDVVYKEKTGFRISSSVWFDRAYNDHAIPQPGTTNGTAYYNNVYSATTKRYTIGPSAEFLDAFVFHTFQAGDVPINVKAGKLVNYWGESLFNPYSGISASQAPLDLKKALANPGTEVKELYMPTRQISFQASLTKEISVAGYKGFQWLQDRVPDGGTYLGDDDLTYEGVQKINLGYGDLPKLPAPGGKPRGDWGLNTRISPSWFDGTFGLYYRQFDEKLPNVQFGLGPVAALGGAYTINSFRNIYAPNVKLWGLSAATTVKGVSVAGELAWRKNAGLLNDVYKGFIDPNNVDNLPRGDVLFGIVNAIAYFGKNALWDQSVLVTELSFSHLQRVNQYLQYFKGEENGCTDKWAGCATKNAYGMNVAYTPSWNQFFPSVDLKMPMNLGIGLKGNVPVPGTPNQGSGSYSLGLIASVSNKYDFELKYIGYMVHTRNDGTAITAHNGQGNSLINDRGWLSFTFKTSF